MSRKEGSTDVRRVVPKTKEILVTLLSPSVFFLTCGHNTCSFRISPLLVLGSDSSGIRGGECKQKRFPTGKLSIH